MAVPNVLAQAPRALLSYLVLLIVCIAVAVPVGMAGGFCMQLNLDASLDCADKAATTQQLGDCIGQLESLTSTRSTGVDRYYAEAHIYLKLGNRTAARNCAIKGLLIVHMMPDYADSDLTELVWPAERPTARGRFDGEANVHRSKNQPK